MGPTRTSAILIPVRDRAFVPAPSGGSVSVPGARAGSSDDRARSDPARPRSRGTTQHSPPPAAGGLASETRLPSGDPLSTRTRPEEGSWDLRVVEDDLEITLWDDDPVLLSDTDLA